MTRLTPSPLHSGEFVLFLTTGLAFIRYINRRESIEKDYPPHRQVNGSILYPPDRKPGFIERTSLKTEG